MTASIDATYVLPFKRSADVDISELTAYLRWLSQRLEVVVVDGSSDEEFVEHGREWDGLVRHLRPERDLGYRNGKALGAITGVVEAGSDIVVIADDDVRYDDRGLERITSLLRNADLVRPQNYFDPMPWHALWDTARSLLNRSVSSDYPGTLGVRRSFFVKIGGYDGDVLFENLELIRTFEIAGAEVATPLDLYVRRLPPTTERFWSQRVRQAYDEFALPHRLAVWLGVIPFLGWGLLRRREALATATIGSIALAEVGRRRAGGTSVFPATATLFAPAWILERALCSWLAIATRLARGGVRYGDGVLVRAATPKKELRRRLEGNRSQR